MKGRGIVDIQRRRTIYTGLLIATISGAKDTAGSCTIESTSPNLVPTDIEINRPTRSLECETKMNVPETASYQSLLEALEDRLWVDDTPEQFDYLVDLVNDLYTKSIESQIATLNGCITPGPAYDHQMGS